MKQTKSILLLPDSATIFFKCDSQQCESKGLLCCRSYHVEISPEEAKLITHLLPKIKKLLNYNPRESDDLFFEVLDKNNIEIPHSSKGGCVFLTVDKNNRPACTIQLAAKALGLDVTLYKPFACRLFPLDLVDQDDTTLTLQLHPDYSSFPCLSNEFNPRSFSLIQLAEAATGTQVDIRITKRRCMND